MNRLRQHVWSIAGLVFVLGPSAAETDEVSVRVVNVEPGLWRFDVTVRHLDKGWEHYAGRWDVVAPDGRVLQTRVLGDETDDTDRPFTRSFPAVAVAQSVDWVTIRSRRAAATGGAPEVRVHLRPLGPRALFNHAASALKAGRRPQ